MVGKEHLGVNPYALGTSFKARFTLFLFGQKLFQNSARQKIISNHEYLKVCTLAREPWAKARMFREIIDLRSKMIELENRRVELTKGRLVELMSGGKVDFDEIIRVMTAEKGVLELLRLKLQEERKDLVVLKEKTQLKLKKFKKDGKAYKTVKRCLGIAIHNINRHIELMKKFIDRMGQGLEIADRNLRELMSDNFDLKEDPTVVFEEARKYLEEEATCLNNALEALAILLRDAEIQV